MDNERLDTSLLSDENSVSSRNSQQLPPRSLSNSLSSHNTDSDERARVDQRAATYSLDVLAADADSFNLIFMHLHAVCSRTDLEVEFINLQQTEGRARWLLGIADFLAVDKTGDTYSVDDFINGFNRVEEERLHQLDMERQQEIQLILQEE